MRNDDIFFLLYKISGSLKGSLVFFCKCVVNHLKKHTKVRLVVSEGILLLFISVLPTGIYCRRVTVYHVFSYPFTFQKGNHVHIACCSLWTYEQIIPVAGRTQLTVVWQRLVLQPPCDLNAMNSRREWTMDSESSYFSLILQIHTKTQLHSCCLFCRRSWRQVWVVFLKVEAHCQSSVLCTSLFCVVKCSSLQGTPYAPSKNLHLGILNNSLCYLCIRLQMCQPFCWKRQNLEVGQGRIASLLMLYIIQLDCNTSL